MKYTMIFILTFALVVRLFTVFVGYHGDLNNQITWGEAIYKYGTVNFYEREVWEYSAPNQPPLTLILLGSISWFWHTLYDLFLHLNTSYGFFPSGVIWFWEDKGIVLLMKLPSIVSDLVIGYLIYGYLIKSKRSEKLAIGISAVWLFNPIVWYNSAVWGQTDAIVNLFGFLSVISLLDKKLVISVFWFTVAVLFKGSLMYFAPILVAIALLQKYKIKKYLYSVVFCLVSVFFVSVFFYPKYDLPIWLYNIYTQRFIPGEIGYLTANAFNFWWIVDSGKTYDSTLFYGIAARTWGFIPVMFMIIFQIAKLKKDLSEKQILFSLSIIAITVFMFMTRIHERYLYPFFPYATLLLAFIPRFWVILSVISAVHLLNLYHLFWVPSVLPLEELYKNTDFAVILSLVNLFCFIFLLRHSFGRRL